jgi:hypothetical protein
VLGASFTDVKAKFYDIVIRSDVGNVDVAWSQKSDDDDELKRLNLSRQRELKQLKDEFKDILDAGTVKPSAPAKKSALPPANDTPPTGAGLPSGSPDQGAAGQRIPPGSEQPSQPATPTVQPGDSAKKPAKKKPAKGTATSASATTAAKGAGQ